MMLDITPSDGQYRAIRSISDWWRCNDQKEFYLAGYAGTGKTTIAQFAIDTINALARRTIKVYYAAYTGKASDVLRRKTQQDTSTLHRLLYKPFQDTDGKVSFRFNKDSPLAECDLLVIDECSMATQQIAQDVRRFSNLRILVLGDPGQLPPIEGTSPFTEKAPDFFLEEIHRQAADSPILKLATMAREGKKIPFGDYGQGVQKIRRNHEASDFVANPQAQVLCGVHRIRWSATAFLRKRKGLHGLWPTVGEPLIGRRNQHEILFWNGTTCTLLSLGPEKKGSREMEVRTDEGDVHFLRARVEPFMDHEAKRQVERDRSYFSKTASLLDFSYVLSCHQAQGSQWSDVVVLDDSKCFKTDQARWLYTALTRAQNGLILVSNTL